MKPSIMCCVPPSVERLERTTTAIKPGPMTHGFKTRLLFLGVCVCVCVLEIVNLAEISEIVCSMQQVSL